MIPYKILYAVPVSLGLLCLGSITLSSTSAALLHPRMAAKAAVLVPVTLDVAPAAAHPNRYHRAKDGLFYVTALVNGAKIRFLVDTGANMVVLTEADALRAGLPPVNPESRVMIETAAGLSRVDRVTLNRVSVAGRDLRDVDAAVSQHGLKVSLLGQNLLSRLGSVTISGNSILLTHPDTDQVAQSSGKARL